jgi:hypothetical protein
LSLFYCILFYDLLQFSWTLVVSLHVGLVWQSNSMPLKATKTISLKFCYFHFRYRFGLPNHVDAEPVSLLSDCHPTHPASSHPTATTSTTAAAAAATTTTSSRATAATGSSSSAGRSPVLRSQAAQLCYVGLATQLRRDLSASTAGGFNSSSTSGLRDGDAAAATAAAATGVDPSAFVECRLENALLPTSQNEPAASGKTINFTVKYGYDRSSKIQRPYR